jgi:hypothetical protein
MEFATLKLFANDAVNPTVEKEEDREVIDLEEDSAQDALTALNT